MDFYALIPIITIFFNGFGTPVDSYDKISKNTTPPEVRIYKPINVSDSMQFDSWSEAIKSAKAAKTSH